MAYSLTEKALRIAVEAHKEQKRKTNGAPYVVHPVMVAMKLVQHGFSETVIAAACVHDVLEDTSVTEAQLREQLGDEVVDIVVAVSEDKTLPWEERKQQCVEQVAGSSEDVKAVSLSDKIHNLSNMIAAHEQQGAVMWDVFARGRDQQLWFFDLLHTRIKDTWQHQLVNEYEELVQRLKMLD